MATQKKEKIGLDILSMRIESGRKENDGGGKKREGERGERKWISLLKAADRNSIVYI